MLPSLTLAFTCGLALGSLIPYFPLSSSILLIVTAIVLTILERRQRVTYRLATAWLCCALMGVLYWALFVHTSPNVQFVEPEPTLIESYTGRIIAPVQQMPDRSVMVVKRDGLMPDSGIPRVIRLTWRVPERLLFQGDRIRFSTKLRGPSGSLNPGGFDYGTYLTRQGIDALASVTGVGGVELLESGRASTWWGLWNQFDRWRGSIRLAALQSLSQPALGLFLGIIIGERGYLDPELRDQFMITGTVHLLSISGSHLGLVALLTFVLVKRAILLLPEMWLLGISRSITATRIAAATTVVPVTGYACLAGAELATVRSLVMLLVTLLAKWLGYEQRMFHALALAALAILLHDPQALFDISFQLSFLSVCAIAAWCARSCSNEEGEPSKKSTAFATGINWAREGVGMSAVVTLATIPLVAFYFNQVPWLGLFTNVIAVPSMGLLLVPLGLFASLWQIIDGSATLPLASLIQSLIDWFAEGVTVMAKMPAGEWHVASPSVLAMLVFYALLSAIWWNPRQAVLRWAGGIGIMLLLLWWIWSPRFFPDGDRFRVTFLDVGQGDSAVIEWPDGQVVLIDGGAAYERFDMGRGVVAPYLWNRGIRTIDHMIGTHPQLDHVGGLAWLLRHFSVKQYWGSGDRRDELFYHRIQQALEGRDLTEQVAREGQEILSSQSCRLIVLNPPQTGAITEHQSVKPLEGRLLNNRSVVTELTCGMHRILFAADIEQEGLRQIRSRLLQEPLDVLKVPHHGALSSLNRAWLGELRPRNAVFSVGRHNSFGHPAPLVLDAYAALGTSIYRTDQDGAVWVVAKPSDPVMQFHRTSDERLQPTTRFICLLVCETSNWKKLYNKWKE
ncbi:DNA internalization-related competence protein ComEC/Rec2 [Petrachloros mirabilis]